MEDYLTRLDLERDYDEMMKLMLNNDEVENVKSFFVGHLWRQARKVTCT